MLRNSPQEFDISQHLPFRLGLMLILIHINFPTFSETYSVTRRKILSREYFNAPIVSNQEYITISPVIISGEKILNVSLI